MRRVKADEFMEIIKHRKPVPDKNVIEKTKQIIEEVKQKGDAALIELTKKFDNIEIKNPEVEAEKINQAIEKVTLQNNKFWNHIENTIRRVENFCKKALPNSWIESTEFGLYGEIWKPVGRVGIYIPGGTAPLISTVIMNVIPAKVAGVEEIYISSPPPIDDYILAAAGKLGVKKVFQIGGAQAIAAFAYGTQTVPKVDVITGPGNVYVTCAKMLLYGNVSIDILAGPSEIMILADESASAEIIAWDLIAQAEHDPNSWVVLLSPSKQLLEKVNTFVQMKGGFLPRAGVIKSSTSKNGYLVLVENIKQAIEIINTFAPEHLEIVTRDPWEVLVKIKSAGTVCLGQYSAVAFGDYGAGPNHTLPTGSAAKYWGALSVRNFMKAIQILYVSREGSLHLMSDAETLAELEKLEGHKQSILARKPKKEPQEKRRWFE